MSLRPIFRPAIQQNAERMTVDSLLSIQERDDLAPEPHYQCYHILFGESASARIADKQTYMKPLLRSSSLMNLDWW